MTYRLTNIYTRKGDQGFTQLRDKPISKDDLLIETIGTIDELNSSIGFVLAQNIREESVTRALTTTQHELFDVGCELHLPDRVAIQETQIKRLEQCIDEWNNSLPPLKEFILPGGNLAAAACHLARTVCRRAERQLVRLHRQVPLANPCLLSYLNRLSDVLFVAARILARQNNQEEVLWESKGK